MAAGHEIATAYVSIVPSMRGVTGGIAKEFAAIDGAASRSGRSSGGAFSKTFNAGIKAATAAATATVATAGVGMGVALTKGLSRLNAIDAAKAKLRGLGNDGSSTAKIMANATAAVKGTAFGLDEAATTAAGAVAAGIKPGKQLESTLTTVANVAAATGRGMDDMGAVFNQVAAGGKAYTMQVKQIADAGLPIWQKLGEELGVTTDQVQKMVSAGEVDFATFERAAAAAAGTVAEEMGQTLPGSIDNAWAAISRFGANVWKGFDADDGTYTGIYSKLTDLVQAFTNAMGPIEDIGAKIGDLIGDKLGPIFDRVTGWLNRFGDAGEEAGSKFKPLLNALGPAAAMFGALGAGGLAPLISKLPVVGNLLGPLPGMLKLIGGPAGIATAGLFALSKVDPTQMKDGFSQLSEQLPGMLTGMLDTITHVAIEIIPAFVEGIVTNLPILIEGVMGLVLQVMGALIEALPILVEGAITLFTGLIQALTEIIPPLIEAVMGLLPMIVETLLELIPQLIEGAITLFTALVDALIEIIPLLIEAVMGLLPMIVETLIELIPQLIEGALALFMAIVEALPLIIPPLLEGILGLLPLIVESLVSMIPVLTEGAVTLLTGIIQAIPIILPPLLQAVIDLIPTIVESLLSMLDALIQGAVALFTGIIEALPIILPELINAVVELVPEMVTALVTEGVPAMLQAGKDIIGGLISGIGDMVGGAIDAVKELGGNMLGGIKNFFGISSPSKVMAKIGGFLDAGLAGGIGKGAGAVAATQKMANQIQAVTTVLQKNMKATANHVAQSMRQMITELGKLITMMNGPFRSGVTTQLALVAKAFQTVLPQAVVRMRVGIETPLRAFRSWFAGAFRSQVIVALTAIRRAFVALPPAVAKAWRGLRSGTASPTNYVISTVYMRGIRAAVNAITKAVSLKSSMPAVSTIGYAAGGVLPGYTPGRDIYSFYNPKLGFLRLSGGEGILRPEVVSALGGAPTIDAWNASRGRGVSTVGDRGYAKGGIIDFLRKEPNGWSVNTGGDFQFKAFDNPKNTINQLVTNPARQYAGRAGGGEWGRGAGGSMVNIAAGYAAIFAKLMQAAGGPAGPGGGGSLVAAARRAIGFPYVWGGSSMPPGLDCSGLVYWAHQRMGKSIPRLTAAGYQSRSARVGSPRAGDLAFWGNPAYHVGIVSGPGRMIHAPQPGSYVSNAAIYGSPSYGRLKYDAGGWLQPGFTMVENASGRPEPVFTGAEFDKLIEGRAGMPEVLILRVEDGPTLRAYVENTVGASGSLRSMVGVN